MKTKLIAAYEWTEAHDWIYFPLQLIVWGTIWYFLWPYLLPLTIGVFALLGALTLFNGA